MNNVLFIWDLEDDPDGNIQHIAEHGLTVEEVESVFRDPDYYVEISRSSGHPIAFGTTYTGRFVVVVWEEIESDPLRIRPITAYEPTADEF